MNALYYDIIKTKLEELGFETFYQNDGREIYFFYEKGSIGIEINELGVKIFRNEIGQQVEVQSIEYLEDLIKFCK